MRFFASPRSYPGGGLLALKRTRLLAHPLASASRADFGAFRGAKPGWSEKEVRRFFVQKFVSAMAHPSNAYPSAEAKAVLGLQLPTDPRWVDLASMRLEDILSDHAYCEQKAATTCISLIVHYPEQSRLVERLSPVVSEEWGHFRMVLEQLRKRGLALGRQRKDTYVNQLMAALRKGLGYEAQLVDRLLICALIEARSCERFRLLSRELQDADLRSFYHSLMISEAGHYRLFIELAEGIRPRDEVRGRWSEWLATEARIVASLEPRGDRMH
jgi:tRNA-(ms[2]io[6]A)-hydroxylase